MAHDIPISQLPSYDEKDDDTSVTWDFRLPPHVDAERLVLDLGHLRRIMAVAALRSIHIGEYNGQATTFTPGISGVDGQGTATAAVSGQLNPTEISKTYLIDDYTESADKFLMQYNGKTRVAAKLNRTAIVSNVVDLKRERGLSSEAAWARQLNAALAESVRDGAREHLVGREESWFRKWFFRGGYSGLSVMTGVDMYLEQTSSRPATYLAIGALWTAAHLAIEMNATKNKNLASERRYSLTPFSGEQWDRYAAVQGMTRIAPMVRAK